jgi:hypothetical protein
VPEAARRHPSSAAPPARRPHSTGDGIPPPNRHSGILGIEIARYDLNDEVRSAKKTVATSSEHKHVVKAFPSSMKIALAALSLVSIAALVILEVVARLLVEPLPRSYGRLAGVELPPIKIVPDPASWATVNSDADVMTFGGEQVTRGDLWRLWDFDADLGYRQRANGRSAGGWWLSNNIGARSDQPTHPSVDEGRRRILVFGDSYSHGSRVHQELVWTSVMQQLDPRLEQVNLAGDGYNMAQAYLRHRLIAETIDYDDVILGVVPSADLWRDINVVRDLAEFWDFPLPLPRAILAADGLDIVPPLYADRASLFDRNHPNISPELVQHLRSHDRFYFPLRHESPPWIGDLILYKVVAAAIAERQERRVRRELRRPGSEAIEVTNALIRTMRDEVTASGRRFLALILPTEYEIPTLRNDPAFAAHWQLVAEALCAGAADACIDMAPLLTALDADCIDAGLDGTHYGPRLNRALAAIVLELLDRPTAAVAALPAAVGLPFCAATTRAPL